MEINENYDTVSDLDVRITAAHDSPDFAREVEEFEDAKRNTLATDEAEESDLHIDPATCDRSGPVLWCPRCGIGCCTAVRDPEDRSKYVCNGKCDRHGHHPELEKGAA